MSASPEEREDAARVEDAFEEEMTDMVDMPVGQTYASDSSSEQGSDIEGAHIANLLQEERRQSSEQPLEDTGVINRYRELAHAENDASSETGSVEAPPRTAASPQGSALSIPDDTPSVQVCWPLLDCLEK